MADWVEEIAGERLDKYNRAAVVLRTIGWISICWAAFVSIWIWMGSKAGSNLWLWWTLGCFVAGLVCLGIGGRLRQEAATLPEDSEVTSRREDRFWAA
ncbi:MAG TPA: hypothetical protein VG897_04035 [Terriglobales bacterium]|nr:hypothetical protein [Terriglobales bacterium]